MPVKLLNPADDWVIDHFEAVVLEEDDAEDRSFIEVDYDVDDYVQFSRTAFDPYANALPEKIRYHNLAISFEDLERLVTLMGEFRRKQEAKKAPFRKAKARVLSRLVVEAAESTFEFPAESCHFTIHQSNNEFDKTVRYLNLQNDLKGDK